MVLSVIIVVLLLGVACAQTTPPPTPSPYFSCIKHANGSFSVSNVQNTSAAAWTKYENNITTSGWAFLTLTSNHLYTDHDQMYAAGFLEGAITRDLIFAFYTNIVAGEYNSIPMTAEVTDWLLKNFDYMNAQIKANPTNPYWVHIDLILTQLQGIMEGYNTYTTDAAQKLTVMDFWLINMDGDMADLMSALNASSVDWSDDRSVIENYIYNTHCSSLVKVADDLSDMFAGHTTWEGYYEMVRIFKTYNLPISVKQSSQVHMFSSYPGALSSIDDYYQTDSKLVVMETTNGIMNNTLYNAVIPSSVLSWIRVIVANKMAADGQMWTQIFSQYNSGTYNNQWIIVDMNRFVKGSHLEAGALWILEQIPGYCESADVTSALQYGYWPSYNVPYFPNIYNVSGFPYYAEVYGPFFTYENNPRAEIFRRDANNVATLEDMGRMLRYNDFTHDVLSQGSPGYAISSRFDLVTGHITNPFLNISAFGGVDSKMTSATALDTMSCLIQSGPSHDNNAPFEWTGQWSSVVHMGLPEVWNFDWVEVQYSA